MKSKAKYVIIISMFLLALFPKSTLTEKVSLTDKINIDENRITKVHLVDNANILDETTKDFIEDVNKKELVDYDYFVYITNSLNNKSMDKMRTKVYKEYDVDKKRGILFVLAIEDREFGIKTGTDVHFSDQLTDEFINDVALRDLRKDDWDNSIYKITNEIARLVVNENVDNDANTEENKEINKRETLRTTMYSIVILSLSLTIGIGIFAMIIKNIRNKKNE